ncbi:MAG: 3,4-dihydroxy-2-butanone-4-phosphate synthase [Roseiflexus sp.]
MAIAGIETALADFRTGRFVIIVDDEHRENEGDLAIAAEYATPQAINFMAREGRGLICVAMTGERLDALQIPLMVPPETNTATFRTAFAVPVEARHGVTTGISAFDRATTIRTLIDPDTCPEDIVRPGHVFPLRAAEGGVLSRAGHTEAAVDLARMAGLYPAAVICEIIRDDGAMARRPDLERFAAQYGIRIVAIADLIAYRRQRDRHLGSSLREAAQAIYRTATSVGAPTQQYADQTVSSSGGTLTRALSEAVMENSVQLTEQESAMGRTFEGHFVGTGMKFGIVISRYNDTIGKELLRGARDTLIRHGVADSDIDVTWTPGAFELPQAARWMARRKESAVRRAYYDAIICLGVVIRGMTPHFEYVAGQAASGIASAAFETEIPITFGVLTTENIEQAFERAGTKAGNRGAEAALAALEMANLRRVLAGIGEG